MKQTKFLSSPSLRTICIFAIGMAMCLPAKSQEATVNRRFDVNRDGKVTVTDVMLVVSYIFGSVNDDEPQLIFSNDCLTINQGNTASVTISGGSNRYLSVSSNPSVAYPVVQDNVMVIHTLNRGDANITVRDINGFCDYIVKVMVTGTAPSSAEPVDLGLPSGLKWASFNVGATAPEESGAYYAWGEINEKDNYDWSSYIHCEGSMSTVKDIGDDISMTAYDAAFMNWGGTWRMPTHDEVEELVENCTWKWMTVNGVNGMQATGPSGETIFFPASGYRAGTKTYSSGYFGSYWTSTHSESYNSGGGYTLGTGNAYYLSVSKTKAFVDNYYQNEGYTIRAVTN